MGFDPVDGECAWGGRRPWLAAKAEFRISLDIDMSDGLQEGINGEGARRPDWGVADTLEY